LASKRRAPDGPRGDIPARHGGAWRRVGTTALRPGAYALVAGKMAHYAWTDGDTTVQIHGLGPFVINYVNPADDPNKGVKK